MAVWPAQAEDNMPNILIIDINAFLVYLKPSQEKRQKTS